MKVQWKNKLKFKCRNLNKSYVTVDFIIDQPQFMPLTKILRFFLFLQKMGKNKSSNKSLSQEKKKITISGPHLNLPFTGISSDQLNKIYMFNKYSKKQLRGSCNIIAWDFYCREKTNLLKNFKQKYEKHKIAFIRAYTGKQYEE